MKRFQGLAEYAALAAIWLGLIVLFGALSENFLSARTFTTLAGRIPALAVVASGMTLVLVIGGIDLSVGSVLGFAGAVLGALLRDAHWPLAAAAGACVLAGTLAGFANGLVSVRLGIPSFIVTLGMLEVARGGAYLITKSETKYLGAAVDALAKPLPGLNLPATFLIALAVVAVTQLILSRTVWGRYMVAIGTNEEAVRLAGIDPRPSKLGVFALSGALAGLAAILHTARLGSSDPNAGAGLELAAIAAVVIGGTSLMGGRGSIVHTLFGVLIIATLEAGLAQIGVSEPLKRVVTGLVIVVAVAADAWRRRRVSL